MYTLKMSIRHKLDKSHSTCADQSALRRVSASVSGIPVDLAPAAYQRLLYLVQSRFLVVVFIIITDDFFRRPPVTGGKRLIPAVEAEL